MFRRTLRIFDDWVYGTGTVITPDVLSELLGRHDLLSYEFLLDQANGAGTLKSRIWHSADEINWVTGPSRTP